MVKHVVVCPLILLIDCTSGSSALESFVPPGNLVRWNVTVGGEHIEVGHVQRSLQLRLQRRFERLVGEAFPVEALEPSTNRRISKV